MWPDVGDHQTQLGLPGEKRHRTEHSKVGNLAVLWNRLAGLSPHKKPSLLLHFLYSAIVWQQKDTTKPAYSCMPSMTNQIGIRVRRVKGGMDVLSSQAGHHLPV